MITTHKITNQRLLFKRGNSLVSTLFVLDGEDNKIKDGYNVKGDTNFKTVVCLNKNLNKKN